MTFGATYSLAMWKGLVSRLMGGNANPTPFLTSFLSVTLPSIRRDIYLRCELLVHTFFYGVNMNLKYR